MQNKLPLVVAHRGAKGEAPENTLGAFRLALEQGCDAFELDVHLSRDGEIMVIHDHTVDRTTNGKGAVKDLTVDEMKRMDAGGWFHESYRGERIPTLEEVIDLTPSHVSINVEIKGGIGQGIEDRLVKLLRRKERVESVFVSSFKFNALTAVKRLEPTLRVGLLHELWLKEHWLLPQAAGIDAYSLHPYYEHMDGDAVKTALSKGLAVFPWTVNKEEDMASQIEMGVTGIITDFPGKLRRLLEQKASAPQ